MEPEVRLYLLGAPRLLRAGIPVELDTRKAIALLAYLALGEPDGCTRDALAALLYPDSDQTSARAALRRTLSPLRQAIGADRLETVREQVRLHPGSLWVDILVFRDHLAQTLRHGHPQTQVCPLCLTLLGQAVELFGDGFMAGFTLRDSPTFDDWQFYQAETARQEFAGALARLALGEAALGKHPAAIQHTRRWLVLDALCEEAHRQLMLLYAWDGQRNAALRQYRECVRILEKELGVIPLEETTQLYQDILENRLPPPPVLVSNTPSQPPVGVSAVVIDVHIAAEPPADSNRSVHEQAFPLVGREEERQALWRAYSARKGFFFVLEGEAGIGKTRLAEEFLSQVRSAGGVVIRARCYEGETELAYAPFMDGLNAVLALEENARHLQELSLANLSLAAQLVPNLAEWYPSLPPAPPVDAPMVQVRFFDALHQVLKTLLSPKAPNQPAGVLFLDDVHWADAASLDLLAYLARRLGDHFLLATWRSDDVPADHRLRLLLTQMSREGRAHSLLLPRLGLQAVADMLQAAKVLPPVGVPPPAGVPSPVGVPPNALSQQLYKETEGSPYFVVEYLQSLPRELAHEESLTWEMPRSVRSLLQTRLAGISELESQLLSAAAVLGRSFNFSILHEVSGRSEVETISGLEGLLVRRLVLEQSGAGQVPPQSAPHVAPDLVYDFSHDKLRSLAYEQISLARRRLLHQRAAEVYAHSRQPREAAALAGLHYRQAGLLPQAAEHFWQAGVFARSMYANREALAHLGSALACGHPDPASLHEAMGDVHMLLAEYPAALSSYEAAAALCDLTHLHQVEHKLGLVHEQRGAWELAECHFQAADEGMRSLPQVDEAVLAEHAMLYADWSRAVHRRGDEARALELAAQPLRLAENSQQKRALAQAYNNLGILCRTAGDHVQAIQHLQRSLELAQALADSGAQAAALNNLGRVLAENGQLEQAIALTQQALELCKQRGDRHREAALHNNLADLLHAAGQGPAAMEHLKQAVVIFAEISADFGTELSGKLLQEPQSEIWKLAEW
jgi:predicted ATPase/DNA-binding SARP family transcriptional activator